VELGFTICTHTTSLSQDLASNQEKLSRNKKNTFTGKKWEEAFRRATEEDPSPRMDRSNTFHVCRMNGIKELQHIH